MFTNKKFILMAISFALTFFGLKTSGYDDGGYATIPGLGVEVTTQMASIIWSALAAIAIPIIDAYLPGTAADAKRFLSMILKLFGIVLPDTPVPTPDPKTGLIVTGPNSPSQSCFQSDMQAYWMLATRLDYNEEAGKLFDQMLPHITAHYIHHKGQSLENKEVPAKS